MRFLIGGRRALEQIYRSSDFENHVVDANLRLMSGNFVLDSNLKEIFFWKKGEKNGFFCE